MATVNNEQGELNKTVYIGDSGNCFIGFWTMQSNSAGKINGTAVGTADVVRIGTLPSGLKMSPADFVANISDAFTASATWKFGFQFTNGTATQGGIAEDDDYFLTATTGSQAIQRGNNAAVTPLVLPSDAYLIATLAGAALSDAGRADLVVKGEYQGTK